MVNIVHRNLHHYFGMNISSYVGNNIAIVMVNYNGCIFGDVD